MNEKLQYATMLDIPVETSNVNLKRVKKRRVKKPRSADAEAVKEKLVKKINSETAVAITLAEGETLSEREKGAEKLYAEAIGESADNFVETQKNTVAETEEICTAPELNSEISENGNGLRKVQEVSEENAAEEQEEFLSSSVHEKRRGKGIKFGVIGVELAVIAVLIASIFLTNAFYEGSAINVFVKKVFSPENQTVTVKTYDEFAPVMKYGNVTKEGAVMTVSYSGAVYSSADGKVSSVEKDENGLYVMTIAHSDAFSSTIYGLKYAYLAKGDAVYGTVPVGYSEETYKMVFATDSGAITDYTLEEGRIKWS